MRIILTLALCINLLAPVAAWAQTKDPLSYPLKQYGFMLATALLGGLVSWYAKLRKGEVSAWSVNHLVGELATSAFAGLLCFWICESAGFNPLITASLVGIAGHMGTRAITAFEGFAQRKWGTDAPKG
jgi:LydA family holin superfamily III